MFWILRRRAQVTHAKPSLAIRAPAPANLLRAYLANVPDASVAASEVPCSDRPIGWQSCVRSAALADLNTEHLWRDSLGVYDVARLKDQAGKYLVRLQGVAEAVIDTVQRSVDLHRAGPEVTQDTLEHFYHDQVLPGLLDHDGQLVVHGGGVVTPFGGLLIAGPSGRGKSTLTTALGLAGNRIQNDDSAILEMSDGRPLIRPIYAGIRLLPETLAAFFPPETPTSLVSHYATKRRVHRPDLLTTDPAPLAAILVLTGQSSATLTLTPLPPAQACMELIGLTMALDPTDLSRARARMQQAAAIANAVPAFALSYPRQLDLLPSLCAELLGRLGETLAAHGDPA